VVFLHGYGANGNDLISIGEEWRDLLPDAAFVSPDAPEPCPGAPGGRQWFRLTMADPYERWAGVNKAEPVLTAFLDAELARYGLNGDRLALVGFSQGTMVALHAGLRRARPPAAILGYSGEFVAPAGGGEKVLPKPPPTPPSILLVHGSEDTLIPPEALFISAERLAKAGIPCQWHLSLGVAHGIGADGLMHGGLFLASALGV
jgi:phospholipase/carboxylesterase